MVRFSYVVQVMFGFLMILLMLGLGIALKDYLGDDLMRIYVIICLVISIIFLSRSFGG